MGSDEERGGRMRITSMGDGPLTRFVRFLVTVVVILLILLGTGAVLVRLEGGRTFVEDQLERVLAHELTIERARIGWPYELVVENLRSDGFGEGAAGFSAKEVRIGWGIRPRATVEVRHGTLRLVRDSEGRWAPDAFAGLGDLPVESISDISRLTAALRERYAVHVSDSDLEWDDAEGQLLAAAGGVTFDMTPVRIPGRRMSHYRLRVQHMLEPDHARRSEMVREWLASSGKDYVEIHREDEQHEGFWEPKDEESGASDVKESE